MKVVTAANFRYLDLVIENITQCKKFSYVYEVYDLGGLGFGKPFLESAERFQREGIYGEFNKEIGWFSKALFKPRVIKDVLRSNPDTLLLWLDADAKIIRRLENIDDFDIALALREKEELEYANCAKGWIEKLLGKYNAGVIFFNPNLQTKIFINKWLEKTEEVGNDQYALHLLSNTVKIKELPHTYNDSKLSKDTIIYHRKGKKSKVRYGLIP